MHLIVEEIHNLAMGMKFSTSTSFMFPPVGQVDGRGCDRVVSEIMVATLGMKGPKSSIIGRKKMHKRC